MATNFKNLKSKPDLFLMIPPPLYFSDDKSQQRTINVLLPTLIPDIARILGLADDKIIDLFNIMGGSDLTKFELFCDG